ncbi:tRNA (adenosine(37)-N6)-threonylcarbamoyltransferase complex dimerization subunit type 1 TsaB [Sanguibacter sp. A247]|uniref:tRNA (adenosine(37)-N6)-threonylcarbamoyltransferase complex dimerization subunit type 1 TsaB n=1 Tax=unclassified Sanguibacter TaxID=2645534 RepID=UPI003FD8C8FD
MPTQYVLSIDTSVAVAVALTRADGSVVAARASAAARLQAESLAPLLAEVLAEAGVAPREIAEVVVGTGPAPFTGLRVGLVSAQTFALAIGAPVRGVCSLDAVALEAASTRGLAPGTSVVVVTDAKRREVYWARYTVGTDAASLVRTAGPGVAAPLVLAEDGTTADAVIVGPGVALYGDVLSRGALADHADAVVQPDPAVLVQLSAAAGARGEDRDPAPLYLRRPDAQVPAASKRATG